MTYKGIVRKGVVVLDGKTDIPDGTAVRVEPAEDRPLMGLLRVAKGFPDDPDWPTDGAAEHDHHLYGTPKQNR